MQGFLLFSREPEDKSWLHQNFSERGDTVSSRTRQVCKLEAVCAKILAHVCLGISLLTPNGSSIRRKGGGGWGSRFRLCIDFALL